MTSNEQMIERGYQRIERLHKLIGQKRAAIIGIEDEIAQYQAELFDIRVAQKEWSRRLA